MRSLVDFKSQVEELVVPGGGNGESSTSVSLGPPFATTKA